MSETMQTLTRKSACVMLSLLLLLSAVLPVKAAAETASAKVVRVGSFEDTFNYVNEKGARKGYGYELLETLSGYTGWQFEYVTCDWSDCFEKLKNGEIDIMGLLVASGLCASRSEARRAVQQGGVSVDGEKVTDVFQTFAGEALSGDGVVLKKGKKNFRKVLVK